MLRRAMIVVLALLVCAGLAQAQNKTYEADDVRLLQTFFEDAPIAASPYAEGFFQYSSSNFFSAIDISAQAAFPIPGAPNLQIGGGWGFRSLNPDNDTFGNASGESGITDVTVSGRYQVLPGQTPISVGALLTLPIGSEDIGESAFDFGFFGSMRHNFPSGLAITGTFGLQFIEVQSFGNNSDRETAALIAGGVIYPLPQSDLSIIGEFDLKTKGDYALLTGGVDYKLKGPGRLRGGIGVGLDDGAPDFAFRFGYLMGF